VNPGQTPEGVVPVLSVLLAIATAILPSLTAMQSVELPRLLNVVEAAQFLGMSRNAIYIACREGRIPHYKVNDWSVRFDLDELKSWLQENRRGPKVATDG
jgi:excisionase family DNA binding protein